MAAKLKNLRIRKVDFVDEGANPDAHIGMLKRKNGIAQDVEEDCGREHGNILKKLFNFIGKAAGMDQEEIDSAVDEIQKGDSVSFSEKINEVNNRKIADEMWDICYALQSSLCSILNDEEIDSGSAETAMQKSLDEFYALAKESISKWSGGKFAGISKKNDELSEADLDIMKSAVERLNETITKAFEDNKNKEGDEKEMKIDKSKLTDAERAFLESIEKRYGEEGASSDGAPFEKTTLTEQPIVEDSVSKSTSLSKAEENPVIQESEQDNIYKGLHPAVAAELEELKKFKQDAEDRELAEVAKKYEIIGKKPEELLPVLKSLKATGGTAYNDMIAVLDQAVSTVEQSGAFSEIGKSGHSNSNVSSAETKINTIAKGYMEKDPDLNYNEALAKAWENNPDIMSEYDEEEGF